MVPRPPILRRPNRRKGAEHVVILGETRRMTITLDGSDGMSFDVILAMTAVVMGVRSWRRKWFLYRVVALPIDKRDAGSGC